MAPYSRRTLTPSTRLLTRRFGLGERIGEAVLLVELLQKVGARPDKVLLAGDHFGR